MQQLSSPCNCGCPVHTDARGYVAAVARGDYATAYRLIRENNPFASACAWVCAHPCEDVCRRGQVDKPIAMRYLKRLAIERGREPVAPSTPSGAKVAIVGSGPSGLTAAHDLAKAGYRVTVFERFSTLGGQLSQTILPYRLDRGALSLDIDDILALGVEARTGAEVGVDVSWDELERDYAATLLAVGLCQGRRLGMSGDDNENVLTSLAFLREIAGGQKPQIGRRVLVVGGGDVAMDAARAAVRLGAQEVACVCLEAAGQMPAHSWEITEAVEEGVSLQPGWGPSRFIIENEVLSGLEVKKVLSCFDGAGRFAPSFDEGRKMILGADTIILAIGQGADLAFLKGSGIECNERGQLLVDREGLTTSRPGVFACGEVAQGPGAAIRAVAHGHRAAILIRNYLGEEVAMPENSAALGPLPTYVRERILPAARAVMPQVSPGVRRGNWEPFELGLDEAAAREEANRCLRCGLGAQVDAAKCAACLTCLRACPYGVPVVGAVAVMSAEGCQSCNFCAAECPGEAIQVGSWQGAGTMEVAQMVAIACQEAGFTPVGVKTVTVPNLCGISLETVLGAFEAGAGYLDLVACAQCRHPGGAERLAAVMGRAEEVLAAAGLGGRVRLVQGEESAQAQAAAS